MRGTEMLHLPVLKASELHGRELSCVECAAYVFGSWWGS